MFQYIECWAQRDGPNDLLVAVVFTYVLSKIKHEWTFGRTQLYSYLEINEIGCPLFKLYGRKPFNTAVVLLIMSACLSVYPSVSRYLFIDITTCLSVGLGGYSVYLTRISGVIYTSCLCGVCIPFSNMTKQFIIRIYIVLFSPVSNLQWPVSRFPRPEGHWFWTNHPLPHLVLSFETEFRKVIDRSIVSLYKYISCTFLFQWHNSGRQYLRVHRIAVLLMASHIYCSRCRLFLSSGNLYRCYWNFKS